jgi:hypothetical protein
LKKGKCVFLFGAGSMSPVMSLGFLGKELCCFLSFAYEVCNFVW